MIRVCQKALLKFFSSKKTGGDLPSTTHCPFHFYRTSGDFTYEEKLLLLCFVYYLRACEISK